MRDEMIPVAVNEARLEDVKCTCRDFNWYPDPGPGRKHHSGCGKAIAQKGLDEVAAHARNKKVLDGFFFGR